MAGSRKGKQKKKKEKSNPHKSKESNEQIQISDVKYDLGHEKEGDICDAKHSEDKKVEILLHLKIEWVYKEACLILSKMGYDNQTIIEALLRGGYIYGQQDILSSIVENAMTLINSSPQENGKVIFDERQKPIFETLPELMGFWVQDLVNLVETQCPSLPKSRVMQHILSSKFLAIEKPNQSVSIPHTDEPSSSGEVSGVKQFDFDTFLKENTFTLKRFTNLTYTPLLASQSEKNATSFASPQEQGQNSLEASKFGQTPNPVEGFQGFYDGARLRNSPEEQIDKTIFRLGKLIGSLEREVEDRKKCALNKRMEARAGMVSHTDHELITSGLEKEKREQLGKEKEELATSMSKEILKKEKARRMETCQLDRLYEEWRKVEAENIILRADLAAIQLNKSESKKNLKQAVKKEKEDLKRIENSEKYIRKRQGLINQDKEEILQ